jgi:hypothetical protein
MLVGWVGGRRWRAAMVVVVAGLTLEIAIYEGRDMIKNSGSRNSTTVDDTCRSRI